MACIDQVETTTSTRISERGSTSWALIALIAVLGTTVAATTLTQFSSSTLSGEGEDAKRTITQHHSRSISLFQSLLQPSSLPSKLPAVYPEPYLNPVLGMATFVPPGRLSAWSMDEDQCIRVKNTFSASGSISFANALNAQDLRQTGEDGLSETRICLQGATRDQIYPLLLSKIKIAAHTKLLRLPSKSKANLKNFEIHNLMDIDLPPPPKPDCRIEVPGKTIKINSRFSAKLRAYGVVSSASFLGKQVALPLSKNHNAGLANLAYLDPVGKFGRILANEEPRARPTHLQTHPLAAFRTKIGGGVEGVLGAPSRKLCSAYVNTHLPYWMRIAFSAVKLVAFGKAFICFAEGTQIAMADGSTKAIEQIVKGDEVKNPNTGKPQRVLATTVLDFDGSLRRIEAQGKTLRVTPNHPVLSDDGILPAHELGAMTNVISGLNGLHDIQASVSDEEPKKQKVYNLLLESSSEKLEDHLLVADGIIVGDLAVQSVVSDDPDFDRLSAELEAGDDPVDETSSP